MGNDGQGIKTNSERIQTLDSLRDEEYRLAFVDESINVVLAGQIRALQHARGWSQKELGEHVGMAQETISLLENPSYGRHTLRTLKRLAAAFNVALIVKFAPFSELADWANSLTPKTLAPEAFDDEINTLEITEPEKSDSASININADYALAKAVIFAERHLVTATTLGSRTRYQQAAAYFPPYENVLLTGPEYDEPALSWDNGRAPKAQYASAGVGDTP
jgi:transcriptional regulator with XRE-family HTH domain